MRKILSMCGFLSLIVALGCGSGSKVPARLHGTVAYKGEKLKGGVIKLVHAEMGAFNGTISPAGEFSMYDLPVGDFVMTIDTEAINPDRKSNPTYGGGGGGGGGGRKAAQGGGGGASGPGNQDMSKKMAKMTGDRKREANANGQSPGTPEELRELYTKIPAKYADETKSDIRVTLKAGDNRQSFELKD